MGLRGGLSSLGNKISVRAGPLLATAYIRLTHRTTRWRWEGRNHLQQVINQKTPVIYAFWHNRILMMCPRMEESPILIRVLISNNRDGEIISRIVQKFGQQTIRGSARNPKKTKNKGGHTAALEMLRHLRGGGSGALTPDGPRGPCCVAQAGISLLSAQSGVSVIPLAYSTNRGKRLRSWDRFLLALPFGRGAYVVGAPIAPPDTNEASLEAHRLEVETTLNDLSKRADQMVGREDAT